MPKKGKHEGPSDGSVPPWARKVSNDTWTKYLQNGVTKSSNPEKWAAALLAISESAELN